MRSFPPDVVVLDNESLTHARFARGQSKPKVVSAKSWGLAANTFTPAMVTPELTNPGSLVEVLKRLRLESGRWEKVSLLLPDSWFRINIVDLSALPKKEAEALEVVRWSLKRTLPIPPDDLRISYNVLSREGEKTKALVLSALDATLRAIEKAFAAAGFEVILIEPIGLNLWNAIAVREIDHDENRIFVHLRDGEFTTAVFRGSHLLFIRSRHLGADRTIDQEIRLSASYLRDSLDASSFAGCWVAGKRAYEIHDTLAEEFGTEVRTVALRDLVEEVPAGVTGLDDELTACTGVFTG
jgi:type IV pilus assembly protein PilM